MTEELIENQLIELSTSEVKWVLDYLFKLKDQNSEYKHLICNKAFSDKFKEYLVNEEARGYKVMLEEVAWFKYIVSPYIKEKHNPVCYLTKLDLNKICWVNSTYEWTIIYIEDFLYGNIQQEWLNPNEPLSENEATTNEVIN